ncbi:tetratricopeptide repeat protein [Gemmatimonadota bacterium]
MVSLLLVSLLSLSLKTFFFSDPGELAIVYPFDGSLFPPEIIAPTIWWQDEDSDADQWRVSIAFDGQDRPITADVDTTYWVPDAPLWEEIKRNTLGTTATITVESFVRFAGLRKALSSQAISISTSSDSVGAPIYYRDVPLPFISAVENISSIKWRLGDIGSGSQPHVVLSDLPVCGNCHSFSADGKTLGMDVDVANDKGAYVLTEFNEETIFARANIFSWNDYFDVDPAPPTFGLLARVSPSGKYVVGGMEDRAVFLARSDLAFSQIFFPVQGLLAYYDRDSGQIRTLTGADDPSFVQANGTWTPDGEAITFARAPAPALTTTPRHPNVSLSIPEAAEVLGGMQYIDESKEGYNKFQYDLYSVPFNGGQGGEPIPVEGASHNGRSNYFPKYSPDGKWLVFNQAESFMLLMPDSKLYIMPAEGGEPRLMNCNTESMNSWHSWSPNSKWLVFSSKLFSPYTHLFLTHIDENGEDTPPILLKNFIIPERAANIPEFVNIDPDSPRVIRERFIDDFNYLRRGRRLEEFGKTQEARSQYLESLRLNPQNKEARLALGLSYAGRGEFEEAEGELKTILELDPNHARTHYALGGLYADQGEFLAAIEELQESLKATEEESYFVANVHLNLGRCHFALQDYEEALEEFQLALILDPENIDAYIHMGNIHIRLGDIDSAIGNFQNALDLDPTLDSLRDKIEELRQLARG